MSQIRQSPMVVVYCRRRGSGEDACLADKYPDYAFSGATCNRIPYLGQCGKVPDDIWGTVILCSGIVFC